MLVNLKKKSVQKKIFIIGSNARLAKAIINYYKSFELVLLPRSTYKNWGERNKQNEIFSYFQSEVSKNSLIFITSGILNSNQKEEMINAVNFHLPWNIISALKNMDIQIITFGTILEKMRLTDNNYVRSKIELSDRISTLDVGLARISHFRLHTLYGYDAPSPFMFLGQIFDSIKSKSEFKMSSGFQIREYHHFDDVVKAIDHLINLNILGISEITSGKGIQLRELAFTIFKAFNLQHLINIGAIEIKHKEKLLDDYERNSNLKVIDFRAPKEGVIKYLNGIL